MTAKLPENYCFLSKLQISSVGTITAWWWAFIIKQKVINIVRIVLWELINYNIKVFSLVLISLLGSKIQACQILLRQRPNFNSQATTEIRV